MQSVALEIFSETLRSDPYFYNCIQDISIRKYRDNVHMSDHFMVYLPKIGQSFSFDLSLSFPFQDITLESTEYALKSLSLELLKNLYDFYKINPIKNSEINPIFQINEKYLLEKYFDSLFYLESSRTKSFNQPLDYFLKGDKILSNNKVFIQKLLIDFFFTKKGIVKNVAIFSSYSNFNRNLSGVIPNNVFFEMNDPHLDLQLRGRSFDFIIFYSFSDFIEFSTKPLFSSLVPCLVRTPFIILGE